MRQTQKTFLNKGKILTNINIYCIYTYVKYIAFDKNCHM